MGELGNIFESTPVKGPKGPDLKVRAPVFQAMLDRGDEILVSVPDQVPLSPGSEQMVPRRRGPGDPPGEIRLHLSSQLRDGVTLRLRGQGGEHPSSGVPGDLLVTIAVSEGDEPGGSERLVIALVLVAMVAIAGLGYYQYFY